MESLIYVPSDRSHKWYKAGQCVWSSEGTSLGKPYLEPIYPTVVELFVDYFGVPKLSFKLAYQQLIEIGQKVSDDMSDIKNLLCSLAELLRVDSNEAKPSFGDEARLCKVFPVLLPDGRLQALSANDTFAILDRQHYADKLKGKIKLLDFSLEEVRRLEPFIQWAGLTNRYLSRLVVEQTIVEDEICNEDKQLTRDLLSKANAFVR